MRCVGAFGWGTAGSLAGGVPEIFYLLNPSDRKMAPELAQGYVFGSKCGRRFRLTTLLPSCADWLEILRASASWGFITIAVSVSDTSFGATEDSIFHLLGASCSSAVSPVCLRGLLVSLCLVGTRVCFRLTDTLTFVANFTYVWLEEVWYRARDASFIGLAVASVGCVY